MKDELARLEKAHREAEAAFEIAQAELRAQIGVTQESEYDRLSRVLDETWSKLQRAREELDRYIRQQHRPSAASASTNT